MLGRKELMAESWRLGKGTSDAEWSSCQGVPSRHTLPMRESSWPWDERPAELEDARTHSRSASQQAAEHACVRGRDF